VLVGNIHLIKNISWHKDLDITDKYLAEYLEDAGINLCTIQQMHTKANSGEPILLETTSKKVAS